MSGFLCLLVALGRTPQGEAALLGASTGVGVIGTAEARGPAEPRGASDLDSHAAEAEGPPVWISGLREAY